MFQKDLLKDKVIFITGGGTGLGKSMALRFADLGAHIALCGRRLDVLEETAKEIQSKGAKTFIESADVRKMGEIEKVVSGIYEKFGRLDGLVNNAAGNFVCPTEFLSPNGFDAIVKIVLYGTFNATQAVAKRWIAEQKGGRILSICTTYAWTGSAFVIPSVAAKAGVLAMTRSLAVEWGKYGIRLNAVAPGPFKTEGAWANLMPPGYEEKMIAKNPCHRTGSHEELANLATYLVSDGAAYINGDCITIDGGEWLQGAGEFNGLLELTPEDWMKMKMQAEAAKKK
ncbi:MAG TPA: 2,4-dienoyl-CoA reductase [Deltaproteobacteria bacterium]|nr:2,4-dienoyl-CoA reductase [Deltaproteobacteria bacterium]